MRHGCPLSGLLFVIGIEILARAIKNDAGIKGIKVGEKEIKVSLYADDTTVFARDQGRSQKKLMTEAMSMETYDRGNRSMVEFSS